MILIYEIRLWTVVTIKIKGFRSCRMTSILLYVSCQPIMQQDKHRHIMSSKPRNCSDNIFPLNCLVVSVTEGKSKTYDLFNPPKKGRLVPVCFTTKKIYKWNSWVFTQHGGFSGLRKGGFTQPTGRDDLTRPSTVEMRRHCRRRSEVANSRRSKKDASTALNTMTTSIGAYMVGRTLGIRGMTTSRGHIWCGGVVLTLENWGPLNQETYYSDSDSG